LEEGATMSLAIPELRKQNEKLVRQLRNANERITLAALQLHELEAKLENCELTKDVTSRIFMGFLMDAGTISELRKWFAEFLDDMQGFDGDKQAALALLETHGVSLRVPTIKEIESGKWVDNDRTAA
jgi:hypothetical protein